MYTVHVSDLSSWRQQARALLQRQVSPANICWNGGQQNALDFGGEDFRQLPIRLATPKINPEFLQLLGRASCYDAPHKWALFYRLVYRLVFEEKSLLANSLDDDVKQLQQWHKTICRDIHKMEAFVRFQKVDHAQLGEVYFAWFETEHDIFPAAASFFTNRFHNMIWSILSPRRCMHWDGSELSFSTGVSKPPDNQDDCEDLWRSYYRSTFNPARLKVQAMQSEMPRKYWRNLPEATLIKDLIRSAQATHDGYIAAGGEAPWQKTANAKQVQQHRQKMIQRNAADDSTS